MATGQVGFAEALDVPGLDAVGARLEASELARSAAYARTLSDALELDRILDAAGMAVSAGADLALRLRCSEWRAERLLEQARALAGLPGGLGVLGDGLLTVEQVGVFVTETARLTGAALLRVWEQLVARLRAAAADGEALPPGRLTGLLRRWVLAAAPVDAVVDRERAQADRRVEVRRREDGLCDLFAFGISGPNAHACLSRIQAASAPVGLDDARTADQRRLDALVDLITGRIDLPLPGLDLDPAGHPADSHETGGRRSGRAAAGCGCPTGAVVPCGADVQVLVPLGAALGTTDELAELVGGGPLDPDLLRRLLLAAPRLRAVWVDENGVPLSTASRTQQPRRGDPADLRARLLALAGQVPPPPEPRHPHDHPPAGDGATGPPMSASRRPGAFEHTSSSPPSQPGPARPPDPPGPPLLADTPSPPQATPSDRRYPAPLGPAQPGPDPVTGAHPVGRPGPYRVPERLRRLLNVRRPLCEWPGCGQPARRCDMEHDLAWPDGPTCGCNVGPCCRRHHRVKQTGWTKTRTATGVRWTGPTGRSWYSPSPHLPPATPVRPIPPLPAPDPTALLTPLEWEDQLDPDDPQHDAGHSDRCDDPEPPEDHDPLRRQMRWHDTTWTLDLADLQAWQDIPHPADR